MAGEGDLIEGAFNGRRGLRGPWRQTSVRIGPSPQAKGGDLGYFTKGVMVPEFAAAAFEMTPGDISKEPVKTQFGWHVIKVEDRRQKPAPTFDEMKDELFTELSQQAIADGISELREGQEIERFEFDGSEMTEPPAEE